MAASVVACRSLVLVLAIVAVSFTGAAAGSSKSLNFTNSCNYTVWPAISSGGGASWSSAAPETTGFELAPGQWEIVSVPSGWSGRLWGRTLCSTDSTGRFTCVTGDCGSGLEDCAGGNAAAPPATLAQFTMDSASGRMDTYNVSVVDGFNLPLLVVAPLQQGSAAPASGNCAPTGCVADLNAVCPADLRVTSAAAGTGAVACKSACLAFGSAQYCCTGVYGSPGTCKPSSYSELFNKACPLAYSYAYDGAAGSTFTCAGGDTCTYTINFCPSTTSGKPSTSPKSEPPGNDGNLPPNTGGSTTTPNSQVGADSEPWRIVLAVAVLGAVTAALGVLAQFLGLFKLCFSCSAKS